MRSSTDRCLIPLAPLPSSSVGLRIAPGHQSHPWIYIIYSSRVVKEVSQLLLSREYIFVNYGIVIRQTK